MKKALALINLGRPLTSFLIALAIFSAALTGIGPAVLEQMFLVVGASVVGFFFGMGSNSLNDYFDFKTDKINHPKRPIPSGKISRVAALRFSITMFSLAMGFAVILTSLINYNIIFLVLLSMIFIITYEKKLKKIKLFGNMLIGILSSFAFLFGGVVVNNILATGFLAICAFLSITSREIVKDIEDLKGDFDKKTLPQLIGVKKASIVSVLFLIIAISISIYAYFPLSIFGSAYLAIVILADIIFIIAIPFIIINPHLARRIMKIGMLIVLVAFIIGGIIR